MSECLDQFTSFCPGEGVRLTFLQDDGFRDSVYLGLFPSKKSLKMRTPSNSMSISRLLLIMASMFAAASLQARFVEHKERSLGPTGLHGVTSPTEIKVTKVLEGSPADGKIKVNDVIVEVGGMKFAKETRKQLAAAIDRAETKQGGGILTLTLKDGRKVDLQLDVLGSYSDTAPYDCPKTDAMITRAADYMVTSGEYGRDNLPIGLLGLLATGEQKYIDVVKKEIHAADWAKPDIELSLVGTSKAWSWGYTNLLLAEYYLLTGDKYVLPALEAYSVSIAKGRDAAGLWGHRMADPAINGGQLHGRLHGYAVMNQSSLPLFISLILADKAGIKHPEIAAGLEQTHGFYTEFIGEGTLPYGVHNPNAKSYNNNGMSGSAAVAFSLSGDKEGAKFFSRMSAAAHNTMETGHTGHYFNQLWTGLGANLAGPEVSAAFSRETRWLQTMNRTWDGGFTYDCSGYPNAIFSYRGLSDEGAYLLNLCLGRGKLYITGRDADPSLYLKGQAVEELIALPSMDYKNMSDEELLAMFGHPMPKVRVEAIWTLRPREHKLLEQIRKMVKEGSGLERESAIGYFGYGCPKEQVLPVKDDLVVIMRDAKESVETRAQVAGALCFLGEEAYSYYNDMLRILVEDKPLDPRGMVNKDLGKSMMMLCDDPYAAGLVTDKELFYAAARKLLDHRRADGRTVGAKMIANIPLEDFHEVADEVYHVMKDDDVTYHSYHNRGPKTGALSIFANLNIEGGIESAFEEFESKDGKFGFKVRMLMEVLPKYGASAKPFLPKLKEMKMSGRFEKPWNNMIASIENADGAAESISFEEAKAIGEDSE